MALSEVRFQAGEEADPPSGLGARLRHARQGRGLTIDQLSRETKIPKRHLEALERDDLTVAPGRIYLRAEVRTYARAVHLDEGLALADLERALSADAPTDQGSDAAPRAASDPEAVLHPPLRTWTIRLVAVLLGVAAGVLVIQAWRAIAPDDRADARQSAPSTVADDTAGSASSASPASSSTDDVVRVSAPEESASQPASRRTENEAAPAVAPVAAATPSEPVAAPRPSEPTKTPPTSPAERPLAPRVESTELVVSTRPSGARVTVDGISWGTSPVTIRHVAPGPKRIRVTLDGYASEERSITLAAGRQQRVEVGLRAK